jgi:hypothetical protein
MFGGLLEQILVLVVVFFAEVIVDLSDDSVPQVWQNMLLHLNLRIHPLDCNGDFEDRA